MDPFFTSHGQLWFYHRFPTSAPLPYISVFAVSVSLPRQSFYSLCARTVAGPVAIQRAVQSLVFGDFIIGHSRVACCSTLASIVFHIFKCTNWLKLSFIR